MKIIDTHSHIYVEEFDKDINDVILRAKQAGIDKILLPNIDRESIDRVHTLADAYPEYCIPMMGIHPCSIDANWKADLEYVRSLFETRKYIAVGEVGIDLYWDKTFVEEQKLALEEQLRWSIELDLPVVIHSRDGINVCIEVIKKIGADKLRGVFHSFSNTKEELSEILALGNFYIGINGIVTFKNSDLRTILKDTDLSHIITETDAPYLSPMPHRGRRNESSYTRLVVEKLSDIYEISAEEVAEITSLNATRLFNL